MTGTSVSIVKSQTSTLPAPSTDEKTPGLCGDQRASYTMSSRDISRSGSTICSLFEAAGLSIDDVAEAFEDGARVFQSLTLQSSALESTKSPRSTGPRAGWKSRLITGAAWPR